MPKLNVEMRARLRTARYLLRCAKKLGVSADEVAKGAGIDKITAALLFSGGCPHISTLEKVGTYLQKLAKERWSILE